MYILHSYIATQLILWYVFNTLQPLGFPGPPYNVVIMGDNFFSEGDQLQLNCFSEGGSALEYIWLLPGNTSISTNTSTLIIYNITASDGGDYTCNVTNDAGHESSTITVYSELLYTYITS